LGNFAAGLRLSNLRHWMLVCCWARHAYKPVVKAKQGDVPLKRIV